MTYITYNNLNRLLYVMYAIITYNNRSRPGDKDCCPRCGGRVFQAERVLSAKGVYHRFCFSSNIAKHSDLIPLRYCQIFMFNLYPEPAFVAQKLSAVAAWMPHPTVTPLKVNSEKRYQHQLLDIDVYSDTCMKKKKHMLVLFVCVLMY